MDPAVMNALNWPVIVREPFEGFDRMLDLVDRLPPPHRETIRRLWLMSGPPGRGGKRHPGLSLAQTAKEIRSSVQTVRVLESEAMAMIRLVWERTDMDERCTYSHHGVRCQQPADSPVPWCAFHWRIEALKAEGETPRLDAYYHRKILSGEITPTWEYLSESEAGWTAWGKRTRAKRAHLYRNEAE